MRPPVEPFVATVRLTAGEVNPMWIGGTDGTGLEQVSVAVTDVPTWQRVAP